MKEDNTPTVTARRREPTAKQRLRTALARESKDEAKTKTPELRIGDARAAPEASFTATAGAPVLVGKFKKRQLSKSWLPTHIYHAKRAHMTPPLEPSWRFAIPLTPTEKSYRLTHRASILRGCVAWDTSYMSSIQVIGHEQSLIKLLRALSVPEVQLTGSSSMSWLCGVRSWSGWLCERDNGMPPIAPATLLWSPPDSAEASRELLFRLHPSAFLQVWQELLKLAKMQRPAVTVHDLRFELGSIEVSGPAASEALVHILHPFNSESKTLKQWPSLANVTNVAILPRNLVVGFSMVDPRLRPASRTRAATSDVGAEARLEIFSVWPHENEQKAFELLNAEVRRESCKKLISQKAINKRKAETLLGEQPPGLSSDPSIPLLLYTAQRKKKGSASDSWILLLPWQYVLPAWYCLMHVPLSSGGQPRFGGLREHKQMFFENNAPWFPGDFPGTKAGWAWELTEREQRKTDWEKRPKSKRIQWETIDLGTGEKGEVGCGWACDWEYLYKGSEARQEESTKPNSTESAATNQTQPDYISQDIISHETGNIRGISTGALVTISMFFVNRGHASTCARIYRLPASDPELRERWLALNSKKQPPSRSDQVAGASAATYKAQPHVPPATDLVGFVTSGNYNLGEGQATAIGSVRLSQLLEDPETVSMGGRFSGFCIVRDAGVSMGRLAGWEVCS
jgi:ribonuclease P/MRP protein subunit POP1